MLHCSHKGRINKQVGSIVGYQSSSFKWPQCVLLTQTVRSSQSPSRLECKGSFIIKHCQIFEHSAYLSHKYSNYHFVRVLGMWGCEVKTGSNYVGQLFLELRMTFHLHLCFCLSFPGPRIRMRQLLCSNSSSQLLREQ